MSFASVINTSGGELKSGPNIKRAGGTKSARRNSKNPKCERLIFKVTADETSKSLQSESAKRTVTIMRPADKTWSWATLADTEHGDHISKNDSRHEGVKRSRKTRVVWTITVLVSTDNVVYAASV